MTKVSVCVPVYGVEKYIARCARALFEQTMKEDIEFIFVDDCTKDRSMEILEEVLAEYPERAGQVKIIHHPQNQGLTGARNTALKAASGEYIIHCDSDDWVDRELYSSMYEAAKQNGADVVCCGIMVEKANGKQKKITGSNVRSIKELFEKSFNTVFFNSVWNKMFARDVALAEDMIAPGHITMGEDLLRTSQMLLKCRKMVMCNDVCYHYFCGNAGAATFNFKRKAFDSSKEALDILAERLPAEYSEYAESCKGQNLFSALRVAEMSRKEFMAMYDRETRKKVVSNRHLSGIKRMILGISLLSYHLARFCCRILTFIARVMQWK